jgi:hypothetical protein
VPLDGRAISGGEVSNPSKQKGTFFESLFAAYLVLRGEKAERRALHGNTDKGDISGIEDWTFELKNRKTLDIPGAIDEARIEAANAGTRWYAAIVKRPRKGDAAEAIAAMPASLLIDLIQELRRLNAAITTRA